MTRRRTERCGERGRQPPEAASLRGLTPPARQNVHQPPLWHGLPTVPRSRPQVSSGLGRPAVGPVGWSGDQPTTGCHNGGRCQSPEACCLRGLTPPLVVTFIRPRLFASLPAP